MLGASARATFPIFMGKEKISLPREGGEGGPPQAGVDGGIERINYEKIY